MKILQIVDLLGARHGGSAQVPYHLAKELANRGHQVSIYASDYKLDRNSILPVTGVKIRSFKTWLSLAGFQATPGIILANDHPDIIHMHNYRTFQNIYTRKHNIPYILQGHGSLTTFFQKGQLKRAFDKVWGHSLLQDASKVIAVTKVEAQQCQDIGVSKDKITIVPNGIDLTEFKDLPKQREFRRKYGLANEKLILYLGRIDKIKGLDLLVEAFATVTSQLNNTKLVIVGTDNGFLPTLKNLITELGVTDKVLFTGLLYGRDKLQAYVDADVFVLPSSYEIFSIALLEACACGIPIVITDCCGIANTIDKQAGIAVPHDRKALANAILNILSCSNEEKQLFSKRGKALVHNRFNWQKITKQFEDLYKNILRKETQ